MISDSYRLRRRLNKLKNSSRDETERWSQLEKDIRRSVALVERREQGVPTISYADELPIAQKHALIKETIGKHQVTILCGETGSGKTTQLPKICLDLGLGIRGKIGHTQPRRLAARAVCGRIAEELGVSVGQAVGYKVRFSDQSDEASYIKLMTDGILLAECHHDPFLNQYDTLIIDEAHERSLNIDFLLGYLKRLIRKRRDLKIIITSATIDPERFARHFGDAPVINVSGRTYPVEVRYRPYQTADSEVSNNLQDGIIDAVFELSKIGRGDILVFLSGERDIRETADALAKLKDHRVMNNTEVLPLLARLSNTEQNRIFHPSGKRRIVLATNVAETSLTVPGIRYVIDSGIARISRYSWRSKIQRLPIEKISQASANQRKGRCGRVAEGICIRLYDEEDFLQRAEFTEPEIKRTNLAAVILQMENLGLGHIDDFPFVEPPDDRLINDGYRLLEELGAIAGDKYSGYSITKTGRRLARLPIDPRLARMLIEASRENSLREVLVIVSSLATQDPRERPMDKQQAADEKHAAFRDKASDFISLLNLWDAYHIEKKNLSGNQLRRWCRNNFISWLRMREWIDTHRQIERMLKDLKLSFNTSAVSYDKVHRALLIGLLANIGYKEEGKTFTGARNKKFNVFPGSSLFKAPPRWIVSAEIVETSQVYARTNAKIDVRWVEEKAKHLLKHHYSNPHWEKRRSQVVAHQQSTLYGLMVVTDRKVNFGPLKPELAREIFIRSALIDGDFESKAPFYRHNRQLLAELEAHEAKSRRRDIIIEHDSLYEFYDRTLAEEINSGQTLDKWLRHNKVREKALFLRRNDLIRDEARLVSDTEFPDSLAMKGSRFPLEYHFDPSNHCDGVTLITPLAGLAVINPQRCEWLIPGLLLEKMTALIRSLPKQLRKNFVPAPNYAQACFEALEPSDTSLSSAMANHLKKMTGVLVPYDAWNPDTIDQHLLMNFRVIDNHGQVIEEGRNLQAIKDELSGMDVDVAAPDEGGSFGEDDVAIDVLDRLDASVEIDMQGVKIKAYPALVVDGERVNLRALESRQIADSETQAALRQFFINALPEQIRHIKTSVDGFKNLCLKYSDFGRCDDLKRDVISKSVEDIFMSDAISSSEAFQNSLHENKAGLYDKARDWIKLLSEILDGYREIKKMLKQASMSQLDTAADIQQQLDTLFSAGFVTRVEREWLQHYPRYLMAMKKRYEKSRENSVRDKQMRLAFSRLWAEYDKRQKALEKQHAVSPKLAHYRWMLEEYRVSLFAQELKTQMPVSEKRLKVYWNRIDDA